MRLICKYGIVLETQLLSYFDLCVPVSALNESHHEPKRPVRSELNEPLSHRDRSLLVGLQYKTQAVPITEILMVAEPLEHIHRQLKS